MYFSGVREDAAEAPGGVGQEAEDEYQHREEIDQRGLAGKICHRVVVLVVFVVDIVVVVNTEKVLKVKNTFVCPKHKERRIELCVNVSTRNAFVSGP